MDFNIAVAITLDPAHEGGFQKNPNDSGNWTGGKVGVGVLKGTNFGISAAQFPNEDIEGLTVAAAKQIYFTSQNPRYWNPLYAEIKDQHVGNKLFDLGVLFGVGTAVGIMQQVLVPQFGIRVDDTFGMATLAAINGAEPISLLTAYKTAMVTRVVTIGSNQPSKREFVGDWIRRINS